MTETSTGTIDFDPVTGTTVALCGGCQWRALTQTQPQAWTALARHFKLSHDDLTAADSARRNANEYARRHRRPDTKGRGKNQQYAAPTGPDRGRKPTGEFRGGPSNSTG